MSGKVGEKSYRSSGEIHPNSSSIVPCLPPAHSQTEGREIAQNQGRNQGPIPLKNKLFVPIHGCRCATGPAIRHLPPNGPSAVAAFSQRRCPRRPQPPVREPARPAIPQPWLALLPWPARPPSRATPVPEARSKARTKRQKPP